MEIVQLLRRLWQLRLWVAIAAILAVVAGISSIYKIDSSGLKKKSIEYGAAGAQILVDSPNSSLTNVNRDLVPLVVRADAFARLMASAPVRRQIALAAGIPDYALVVHGPVLSAIQATRSQREPPAQQRSNDILSEGVGYTLQLSSPPDLPVIQVYAEAPTPAGAIKLANAAGVGLKQYLTSLERQQGQSPAKGLLITPLGTATGGLVNQGTGVIVAVLATAGVWIALCILILLISNVARQFRQARALERIGAAPWTDDEPELAGAENDEQHSNGTGQPDRVPASTGTS